MAQVETLCYPNIEKTIVVSGGFDPIHIGHIRMINHAAQYGKVIVVLNNDNWLMNKKNYVFMPQEERLEVLRNMKNVHDVLLSRHKRDDTDKSIFRELRFLQPDIFANGGDRKSDNIPEYELCHELGIEMYFNIGGDKVQSSSEMVKQSSTLTCPHCKMLTRV